MSCIRLQMPERIASYIEPEQSLPAVGQGAVGIECRLDDLHTLALLKPLEDPATRVRVTAERAMNLALQGGCQVPIGGYAELSNGLILLRGLVGRSDGSEIIRGEIAGRPEEAEHLGVVLAEDLLSRGADAILKQLYAQH